MKPIKAILIAVAVVVAIVIVVVISSAIVVKHELDVCESAPWEQDPDFWAGNDPAKNIVDIVKKQHGGNNSALFDCCACELGARALHFLLRSGMDKDKLAAIASGLCSHLGVTTERVCQGLSNAFKDEVVFVFGGDVLLNPADLCSSILDQDCGSGMDPSNNWTVVMPNVTKPPVTLVPLPKAGSPILRVLQLSDVHYDPEYQEGARADCREPLCCRLMDPTASSPDQKAGPWGDYSKCDTPLRTLESLLSHVSTHHRIDYILWTGDDPPHNVWEQTREGQKAIMRKVATLIQTYFPEVPVFPALGNHEGIPVNSFPLSTYSSSMDWLYEMLSETWTNWLPSETVNTILRGGFYSVPVFPGFRIISLNMNYCNDLNWWLLLNTTDPLGELQWLIDELQKAEVKGSHHWSHPSRNCGLHEDVEYESTIRSQFFGHTHLDEFEMFYVDGSVERRPASVAYVGPSVTTYVALNPAYRIYVIDGNYSNSSWAVLDHETYFLNLTEANHTGKDDWNFLYAAKSAYGMKSLQPEDWQYMWHRLAIDDGFFQVFYRHLHRGNGAYEPCNDATCRRKWLCRLQSGRSRDFSLCERSRKS